MKKFAGFRLDENAQAEIKTLVQNKRYKNFSEFMDKAVENLLKLEKRKDKTKDFLETDEGREFLKQLVIRILDHDKQI
jgi:Arc/MetJ-type ribon-helix-helix transcriptional regulator